MKSPPAHVFLEHSTKTNNNTPPRPPPQATTVPLILFEDVLQSPACLSREAKLSDRAGIISLSLLPYNSRTT